MEAPCPDAFWDPLSSLEACNTHSVGSEDDPMGIVGLDQELLDLVDDI